MKRTLAVVVGLLLLVLLVLFSTTYTVRFHEVAVRTTFGKTSRVQDEPGVHFRYPLFADRVTKYDTRLQLAETPLVEVPTADGQSVVVRAFLMWRIAPERVLTFARSYPEKMTDADRPITDQLHTAVKGALGGYAFDELIGAGGKLPAAEADIKAQLGELADVGVEPVTVGISRIKLPAKASEAVLARMQATRAKLAEAERTRGDAEAVAIRSQARSNADKLQAFAEQRSEEIKGEANQRAAVYLAQMREDPEFAIFLAQLDALKASLARYTTIFLSDEAAPWHLLNQQSIAGAEPIPQPPDAEASPPRKAAAGEPREDPLEAGGS